MAEALAGRSGWGRRNGVAVVFAVLLGAILAVAVLADLIAPHDPFTGNVLDNLMPPMSPAMEGPAYLLGTDANGRDVLSVILHGARVSLTVGFVSVLVAGLIGTALGLLAGWFRGAVDEVVMRLVDVQLAFPFMLLALIIMFILGPGLVNVIAVLIVTTWPLYARVARAEALRLRRADFVQAARTMGAGDLRIVLRHVLPNALTPLIVVASAAVPQMIVLEAALSFLGVGMPPATPSWGGLLAAGRSHLAGAWWVATFPGLAIMVTVLGINVLGDWLRDRLDPSLADR